MSEEDAAALIAMPLREAMPQLLKEGRLFEISLTSKSRHLIQDRN